MSGTHTQGDTKYLFKRDKTWWVKLAVPRDLREVLGYDLRRSLHTHDLDAAREARWEAIEEFREKIDEAKAEQGDKVAERQSDGPVTIGEHICEIVSDSGEG